MDDQDPFIRQHRTPTAARPLLGMTVLVVEDSRYACEALRLLCLRSGARIRRADCLSSARRHLQVYRPTVAVIDLGLPDGDGADLIRELAVAQPRIDVILAMSGDDASTRALEAGADGYIAKPVTSLAAFQQAILSHLPEDRRPAGLRPLTEEEVVPDLIAYRDDMAHMAELLDSPLDDAVIDYVAQFLGGVARSASDEVLARAVEDLRSSRRKGVTSTRDMARLAGLIQDRVTGQIAI